MTQNEMFFLVVGFLLVICFIWAFIKRPGYTVFLAVRAVFHIILLYGIQLICIYFNWGDGVMVNAVTALISGTLGIPGIIFLYIIKWYLG